MATYYSTSSNQRDGMPNLYLRGPGDTLYQEPSLPGNMIFPNYSSAGSYSDNLADNSQSQQNCAEFPVPNSILSQDPNLSASRIGEHTYGVWRDGRNEMMFMQPTSALTNMQEMGGHVNTTNYLVRNSVNGDPQMDFRTQLGILHGGQSIQLQRPNVSAIQGQGLSLSLSTQLPSAIPMPSFQYRHTNTDISLLGSHQPNSGDVGSCRDDSSLSKHSKNAEFPLAYSGGDHPMKGVMLNESYVMSGLTSTIPNSKYLKAVQELLDEVVNVRKALKKESHKPQGFHMSFDIGGCKEADGGSKGTALTRSDGMALDAQDSSANSTTGLSPSERQDLQKKLTKLLSMLDEVDRKYKQYYHQMQIVVSSFDVIGGSGAARPYTALALQTISRHFRCLQDAISRQIRATRNSLGEQDSVNNKEGGISRLRFVDQQLRQQRALQQIGIIHQHAWRPQRGLPESSVSILRAWLFEHFLHPYPKDSDKIMLARETGLTRSQVSNWFINARVRLWKPMVEEMYKEEIGDADMDSNSSSDNVPKTREEIGPSDRERSHTSQFSDTKSDHISDVEMNGTNSEGPNYGNLNLMNQRPNLDDCSLLQDAMVQPSLNGGLMAYQMSELGRFGSGEVSLTLGLQHCEGSLPVSGSQPSFVTVKGDEIYNGASVGDDTTDYDYMNLANPRHRFSSSHLLHDFVA
ncbi:BEL1-like homeodomain protein 7 [Tasmannia lanceolata]|uniref:BEL1-like homeodomain protein 7 n=1 Tax=Tasmannia lanceolata TaxID=3420 RepID=UPI004062E5C4